jgi:choline-sulfatase
MSEYCHLRVSRSSLSTNYCSTQQELHTNDEVTSQFDLLVLRLSTDFYLPMTGCSYLRTLACSLLFCFISHASAGQRMAPPDVFLITIDTLRADHVHCYGYDRVKTPALDALAKDGIRFAQAFTPSPITNTSHASILTGLLPGSHGVTDFGVPLSPAHKTLAELLRNQGYQTAAFIGAVILDSKTLAPGFDRGFDFYDNFPQPPRTNSRWDRIERRGMEVVQHAQTWLSRHPTGQRFVWLHLYDPHDPYVPPEPYSRVYADHLYDGEIAYADSALAKFIAYLKKIGRYEHSIIVVVGDHGEGLGEHNEDTHGIFLYDSTMHVPLIVKQGTEIQAGTVVSPQVMTVDILPTILELVNAPALAKTDGESLKPFFTNPNESEQTAFGATDYPLRFGWAPLRSVRSEGFKYIEAPRPEFYDLRSDPAELDNKYEPWNDRIQKERGRLAEQRAKEAAPEVLQGLVGQETIAELKALGYIGRADAGSATTASQPSMLPDPKDKIEQQNLLHAAMVAVEENHAAEARTSLEKVLVIEPKSPIASRQLGELELRAGDYDRAAQHLKTVVEAHPDDAMAWFEEAQALVKLHDLRSARDALEASLKIAPEQLRALLLLGGVYLTLGNPTAAEDEFDAALLLEPKSTEAELGLAKVEIAEGDVREALRHLEPLAKVETKNSEVFMMLAQIYTKLGKVAEAKRAEARAELIRERSKHPSSQSEKPSSR